MIEKTITIPQIYTHPYPGTTKHHFRITEYDLKTKQYKDRYLGPIECLDEVWWKD